MKGETILVPLALWFAACGGRTETDRRAFEGMGGDVLPDVGSDNTTGGRVGAGGGGRTAFGSGGRTGTGGLGFGGRGAGGSVFGSGGVPPGSGGVVAETGGRPQPTPEDARLVAYVCRFLCKSPDDCPSAEPYAGGCNGISHSCLITCEKGCPPGTQTLSVAGGCFCYDPRVNAAPQNDGSCCSSYCGPPYYLACCNGGSCGPDGTCCPPLGCF